MKACSEDQSACKERVKESFGGRGGNVADLDKVLKKGRINEAAKSFASCNTELNKVDCIKKNKASFISAFKGAGGDVTDEQEVMDEFAADNLMENILTES